MSRTVLSPAGTEVLVLDDDEAVELAGAKRPGSMLHLSIERRAIVEALWQHGPIQDDRGHAAGVLGERAGLTTTNVTNVLKSPLLAQCVEREAKTTRCYRLALVALPERWLPKLNGHAPPEPEPEPEVEQPTLLDATSPPPIWISTRDVADYDPTTDDRIVDKVATALLAQVVEVLAHGKPDSAELARLDGVVHELQQRLASQLDYTSTLRQQMRLASDELVAVKQERDGLRARLRAAEHNLTVATTGDTRRIIDAEVHRAIDRFMRETPKTKAAGE